MSLCENNCNYIGYNTETKQSICDCQAKNKIDLASEIANNSQKLSDPFSSEEGSKKGTNVLTLKCTNNLFSKDGLIGNISSYIISASMIYFLVSILLFLKCGYPLLIKQMKEIVQSKKPGKNKNQITNKKNLSQKNHSKTKKDKKKLNAPPKKLNHKKGKSLDWKGNIILTIENGNIKEFFDNGQLMFKGKYLNGKKWNGIIYNYNGIEKSKIINGKGDLR
jgi:hypothetical protein